MTNDDPRSKPDTDQPESGPAPENAKDSAPQNGRQEPVFTDFDEDYEELDRDTDYASAYKEEGAEDGDSLDSPGDENPDDTAAAWQVLGGAPNPERRGQESGGNPWEVEASEAGGNKEGYEEQDEDSALESAEGGLFEDYDETDDEDWEESDEYSQEEEPVIESTDASQQWPWSIMVVGVVALVLLAAGGYGVIQQRSAAQEEIRQLQATLATAASSGEVSAGRDALREMEERITRSQATIDQLTLENRRLSDTVAGLEQQLTAQIAMTAKPKQAPVAKAAPVSTSAAKPAPASKPATTPNPASTVTAASGDWFVNFSSYGQRSVAESWVKKLTPALGKAIVAEASKDGRIFYRVRVVGLADRGQAEKVAGQLQKAHGLPPLWVGKQ